MWPPDSEGVGWSEKPLRHGVVAVPKEIIQLPNIAD